MSVWKRLTNVAKGKVKVWQNGSTSSADAAVDRELSELERHPAPGESRPTGGDEAQRARRPRRDTRPASPSPDLPNPAEEPVARTDLFPDTPAADDDAPQTAATNGTDRSL